MLRWLRRTKASSSAAAANGQSAVHIFQSSVLSFSLYSFPVAFLYSGVRKKEKRDDGQTCASLFVKNGLQIVCSPIDDAARLFR